MPAGIRVNDIHSGLNEAWVAAAVEVDSLEAIRAALEHAEAGRLPVAIAGCRHSMGGQQLCSGGLLLDATAAAAR